MFFYVHTNVGIFPTDVCSGVSWKVLGEHPLWGLDSSLLNEKS